MLLWPPLAEDASTPTAHHRRWEDGNLHDLSKNQLLALKWSSLAVSSISIVSTVLALHWFFRMRRTFRHDLIMLVMQGDMFKAIWFMVYPLVELAHGPSASTSTFCQVSGFFLALAIEACDVAVVLVALHTALYVFLRGTGLYPYRYPAYSFFVCMPLLLAGLAFLNTPAYVNSGEYCYLPHSPDWTRRALSWIPRYVIFATLIITYACIYVHAVLLMNRFGAEGQGGRPSPAPSLGCQLRRRRTPSVPPIPQISYHGLIPSTPSEENDARRGRSRRNSGSVMSISPTEPLGSPVGGPRKRITQRSEQSVRWLLPNFGSDSAVLSPGEEGSAGSGVDAEHSSCSPRRAHMPVMPPPAQLREWLVSPSSIPPTRASSIHLGVGNRAINRAVASGAGAAPISRSSSLPNLLTALRGGPLGTSSSSSVFLSPTVLDETGVAETRDKIRRQLRQLFVYPMVYLAVWLVPFISHVVGGDSSGAPFVIVLIGLISLCIQGTVDALVFSIKERPWTDCVLKSDRSTFALPGRNSREGINPNVGRSREEMIVDGKIARKRRQEELDDRRRRLGQLRAHEAAQNWWDRIQRHQGDTSSEEDVPS